MHQTAPLLNKKPLLLYLEDDLMLSETMTLLLEMSDFTVIHAESTERAITLTKNHQAVPVLILSDYKLKYGECGIEAIQSIRQLLHKPLPAILLTGNTDISVSSLASWSIQRLLIKPIDIDKLIQEIHKLLPKNI